MQYSKSKKGGKDKKSIQSSPILNMFPFTFESKVVPAVWNNFK